MSQQDNFFGGFWVGAIVGGVVGGVLGVLVAPRLSRQDSLESKKGDRHLPLSEQNSEDSRRGLEDKIAQLNDAIDDVRQQLGGVNGGNRVEGMERVRGDRPY
ncbi:MULTISPECIES: hypothetical protein [Cyanophyceae]|uniref:YtxH domain-containing protein n=2 Tax=Thermoleptolyngbya TaxID=2303528 RepID=A0A6M8BLF6_9CYAN|nr:MULTISPECIES: hypothetical protein [Cyanophyceae]WOB42825.1 hypothetical protein HNI00_06430 [Thermoleptolyngbya oregonensis NK1-22]MBF2083975.1 hypothetical protein [Thermoleptolyngbya sp. C42_A2020_037]MDG2616420.1 hypothetical protein [Thermoleptolyngbya sichuanensis XZ-Cy5]QKD84521.1 hypothetical protein HPC62_22115 [Thermoleptolyngbya sichuanensis A183]BAU42257.1 hypothetical protein O77CONTIG1_02077 [Leptolyngbya sp. O-77]